jgi:hypothetical protein
MYQKENQFRRENSESEWEKCRSTIDYPLKRNQKLVQLFLASLESEGYQVLKVIRCWLSGSEELTSSEGLSKSETLADFETPHINFFSPQLLTSNPINNTSTIFPCLCLQQCILNLSFLFNNHLSVNQKLIVVSPTTTTISLIQGNVSRF